MRPAAHNAQVVELGFCNQAHSHRTLWFHYHSDVTKPGPGAGGHGGHSVSASPVSGHEGTPELGKERVCHLRLFLSLLAHYLPPP